MSDITLKFIYWQSWTLRESHCFPSLLCLCKHAALKIANRHPPLHAFFFGSSIKMNYSWHVLTVLWIPTDFRRALDMLFFPLSQMQQWQWWKFNNCLIIIRSSVQRHDTFFDTCFCNLLWFELSLLWLRKQTITSVHISKSVQISQSFWLFERWNLS